jgi:hypothetical protein
MSGTDEQDLSLLSPDQRCQVTPELFPVRRGAVVPVCEIRGRGVWD